MNRASIQMMGNDITKIKDEINFAGKIDINYIIGTFNKYSQEDLYLFRDCIDLMLIYNKK